MQSIFMTHIRAEIKVKVQSVQKIEWKQTNQQTDEQGTPPTAVSDWLMVGGQYQNLEFLV